MIAAQPKPTTQVGAAIRQRRQQLRLTLQQLGEKSGVSYSYLSQVERNNATPRNSSSAMIWRETALWVSDSSCAARV